MYKSVILVAALAATMTGCAAPLVKPNPIVFQSKVAHASDWQALADRSVARFAATLHAEPPSVFVNPGPADMPFAAAFKSFVEAALLKRGYPVVESAAGAVVLNFDIQTYLYGDGNKKYLADYASFWTTAGAIGTQLRHISSYDTAVAAGFAAGPILDLLETMDGATHAEVVLTVSVKDSSRLHYLDSETFYAQPSDLPFYWTKLPSSAGMAMPTGQLSTVALPVTGRIRQ